HKGMTWQITLSEPPHSRNHDVEAWDLDLFDTPSDVMHAIHDGGSQEICYLSSGTYEPFRTDIDGVYSATIGKSCDDPAFADEKYLDLRSSKVLDVMRARLDL